MKLFPRILVCIIIGFLALAVLINPLITFIARGQLKARLPGSIVSISRCEFNPFRGISLSEIQVSKAPVYDLKIKSLKVGFSPVSVLKAFRGDILGAIVSCEIVLDTLDLNKSRVTGGYLRVSRTGDNGKLSCAELKYEKLKVTGIKGKVSLEENSLRVDSLSGQLLGGSFKCQGLVKLGQAPGYQAKMDFFNLDLGTFMKDFALNEKAEVSGKVSGFLKLSGDNRSLELVEGKLGSDKEGGILTIKDTEFLQNMARSSGQALDLVVESFKNYRYNTGKTILSLENNNLVFWIDLDGIAGKRSLNIILHDLNPGG